MRNVLRRLLSFRPESSIVADVAHEDWTPPPPSETGHTDWARWLTEEPPKPRPAIASSPRPAAILNLNLPSALADQSDDIVGTWAELEELEEPAVGEPVPAEPAAVKAEPEPKAEAPREPRKRRTTMGGGRARIRTPMPERRWRDVLTEYAEHLTDEELAIIRKQMAK